MRLRQHNNFINSPGSTSLKSSILHFTSPRRGTGTATLLGVATLLAASASMTATAAGPAAAAAVPALTVTYTAADLASEQGTHALYERIVKAARDVCPRYDSVDLDTAQLSWACQRKAVAAAVQQINSPRLAAVEALHDRHG